MASATRMVERSGTDGFSLREVARETGVSAAAPYRHYTSKDALLAELARRGFEQLHAALRVAGAGLDRREGVVSQCLAYIRFAQSRPGLYKLMFGATSDKRGDEALALVADRLFLFLEEALGVAGERPAARAIGCWSFVHGLAMLAIDGQLDRHLDAAADDDMLRVLRPLAAMVA